MLPAKRPRHHPNVKRESNSDVRPATSGPFRSLQTGVWTPISPKRFAETPETCFKNDQPATENTPSATPGSLTPIQRVEAFVASEAPEMEVGYWDYSDGEHCCVSEKDLSRFDKNLISTTRVSPFHVSANVS